MRFYVPTGQLISARGIASGMRIPIFQRLGGEAYIVTGRMILSFQASITPSGAPFAFHNLLYALLPLAYDDQSAAPPELP